VSWRHILGVAAFAALLHAPSLANGFAYDDAAIVGSDARIRSLANIPEIFTGGYWDDADQAIYRPLTTLCFATDWAISSGSPVWFHATNVVLHALASALVLVLLAHFFVPAAALAGTLLFAVHPVHVEAIANVVGRGELLAAVFVFGAGLLWLRRGEDEPRAGSRGTGSVALLLALGLLSKESAVMLPALLVLLDAAKGRLGRGTIGSYVRRNAGAFVVFALVIAGYLALRGAVLGAVAPSRLDPSLEVATTFGARLLTALQAWPVYLRLMFFPRTLLADYGPRVLAPADALRGGALAGLIILCALVAGAVVAARRGNVRTVLGLLWFPVAVFPVSNLLIPIGVLVAERTLYVPSFALSVAAAGAVAAFGAWPARVAGRAALAGATIVIVLFAVRTLVRIPEWKSTDTIMDALARDRPDAFRAQWHRARMARVGGEPARALALYDGAIKLWPHREKLVLEAAGYAAEQGQRRYAYELARWAAGQWPDHIDAQRLLAGTSLDVADTVTARVAMTRGLGLAPGDEMLNRMRSVLPPDPGNPR
jgi:hypothetical protein